MGLKLEKVVPWGRSFAEYVSMFNLTDEDLQGQILDCAAGPASFNLEMKQKGYTVISCDPIYQFSQVEIAQRIQETYLTIIEGVEVNKDKYVWKTIKSPQELGQVRMAAMQQFLDDFPQGIQEGRYLVQSLPKLPFAPKQFDLALCSHFLFTYWDQLSFEFHLEAISEMCRVAQEVRIFPILNISGNATPFLNTLRKQLEKQRYTLIIKTVAYEFQRGGNQLLVVR